jgi:hypothetical protein
VTIIDISVEVSSGAFLPLGVKIMDDQPSNNMKQDLLEKFIVSQQVIKLPLLDLSFSRR